MGVVTRTKETCQIGLQNINVPTSEVAGGLDDGCAVDDGANAVGAVDGLELEELGDVEHHGTDHDAEHVVPVRRS